MNARQLIELLRQLPPQAEVCTWDGGEQTDLVIEQVLLVPGHKGPVVVLGFEIDSPIVEGAEIVWTEDEAAERGLHKAQAQHARARREAVG